MTAFNQTEFWERIRARNERRCHYDFGDGDWCEKPKHGDDESHAVFAPKCSVVIHALASSADVMIQCTKDWDHVEDGDPYHEATQKIRWT